MLPRRAGRAIAVAIVASLISANAIAQVPNFTLGPNTVVGRSAIGIGPAQAIPFQQLLGFLLQSSPNIPTINTNSIVFKGSISGQATVQAQAATGTTTILLPNTSGTLADSAVFPLALNATTGAMSCPTCSSQFVATRSAATALDLHLATVIQSGGYATAGDGGGATFKNVGSAPFIDSFVTSVSVTPGSGCTNGTFFGVQPTGGTGRGFVAIISVVGGVVLTPNFAFSPGNAYSVGDLLTLPSSTIGCANASLTVTGVSAPLGSFTDSVGTHFQFTPDQGAYANIRQFGAKQNWDGNDATATDDFNSIQAALRYAAFQSSTSFDSGGFRGSKVVVPQGSSLVCGPGTPGASLQIPGYVYLEGAGAAGGTTLKMCNAFDQSTHFIELCDPNWHFACFNAGLRHIELFASRSVSAGNLVAMIHTNAAQDFGGLSYVYIYSGARSCSWFEKGFGGASQVIYDHVSCTASGSNVMMRFGNTVASGLNYGSTNLELHDLVLGGPSSGNLQTAPGILLQGGFYDVTNVHCEGIPVCVQVQIPSTGNGDQVSIRNVNASGGGGGTACTGTIQLDPTNVPGNTSIAQVPAGSCANVVTDAQPSGVSRNTAINGIPIVFNP
jgi:hypothetical protein